MKDKLETMFKLQAELNARIALEKNLVDPGGPSTTESADLKQWWIQQLCRAVTQEAGELLDCTEWKWWKDGQVFDEEHAKTEVVDLFHFIISMAQVLGMTPDELFSYYCDKNDVNHQRQDGGY